MEKTCCFTGHRILSKSEIECLKVRIHSSMTLLENRGVDTFITGGAIGFDMLAAQIIAERKKQGAALQWILALPCKEHDKKWTEQQKTSFSKIMRLADRIVYVSQSYSPDCMKKRNYYMIDHSRYCICACRREQSGTAQTIRYALEQNRRIIPLLQTSLKELSKWKTQ